MGKTPSRITRAWQVLTGRESSKPKSKRSYDAAKPGNHADGWIGSRYDANSELSVSVDTLRQRSRDLIRNNAYARKAVTAYANLLVGTGLRPTIDTGSPDLDATVYDLWERWGKVCVAGSKLDVCGLQRLMVRSMLADGDALLRVRPRTTLEMPGLPPVKLQPLEIDHLPSDMTQAVGNGLNRIISGVETDAIGEVVAYHLYKEHPGLAGPFGTSYLTGTVRVPSSSIIHLFSPDRPGQLRGEPLLAPVMLSLWDLGGYMEAIRVGTRGAATLVATVKGGDESEPPDGLANDTDDTTGELITDTWGNPVEYLTPGVILYAQNGKEITIHQPQPPQGVSDFVNASLHEIAAGVGLSYHTLSGDMSDASFSQAKLGLINQAQEILLKRVQVFIPLCMNPIWKAFIDAAIAAGLLPDRMFLYNVKWSAPLQQQADRLDEVKAAILEMQAGFRSREDLIESMGYDYDAINAAIARDKTARDELGIVSIGDISQVTTSGQAQMLNSVLYPTQDSE